MTSARPPVMIVPGRERPHELVLSVYAVALGALFILGVSVSTAAQSLITGGWVYVYGGTLVVGGLLTLLGSFWMSNIERGLEMERSGLLILAGALMVYAAAVFGTMGLAGVFAGGMALAWVWANVSRSFGITRDLSAIRVWTSESG